MRDTVPSDVGQLGTASLLLTPLGGPEALFQLNGMSVDGRGTAHASMATGRWLTGADGRPAAGALGVLLDDVLGQAVAVHRPDGHWPVTTELAVEFCRSLPMDGSRLVAEAEMISVDGAGGLGRGTVRDGADLVVAVGSTWSRFLRGVPESVTNQANRPADIVRWPTSLRDLLAVEFSGDDLVVPDLAELENPAGVVHGGVIACVAECAARHAVAGSALATASLRVAFLRPAVAPVIVTPSVLHAGRSLVVVEVVARGADSRTCSIGTVSLRSSAPARCR